MPRHVVLFAAAIVAFCSRPAALVRGDDPPLDPAAKTRDYVQTALKYELDGENDRRGTMLAAALETTPDDAAANWHTGRVLYDGHWIEIAEAQRLATADATLTQYRDLRNRAGTDPGLLVALARWCARQSLPELSKLHYTQLAQHPAASDKSRAEALQKLNVRNVNGVLMTEEEVRARQAASEQIEAAMKKWRPQLERWQPLVESNNPKQREHGSSQLDQIDDPHAVVVAETFIAESGPNFGERLVALIGRFEQQEATEALVRFAVLSPWQNVRTAAAGQLRLRSQFDYMPMLLKALVSPIDSRWSIARDSNGNIRYEHLFFRAGQQENQAVAREHVSVAVNRVVGRAQVNWPRGQNGPSGRVALPVGDDRELELDAVASVAEAYVHEQQVAKENAAVAVRNETVLHALETTSGVGVHRTPEQWWLWWKQQNEDVRTKKTNYLYLPTRSAFVQDVVDLQYGPRSAMSSCFVAGTKVWTDTGFKLIEQFQPGDRVLSQNPDTGELAFKLVLEKTAGQPSSPVMELNVEGEQILPTFAHVMWVNGKGWRVSKRLELGNWLHGVNGALLVEEMKERPAPPLVHNLVVQDFHTYFVGDCGLMVHDITYREPTRAIVPGLLAEKTP